MLSPNQSNTQDQSGKAGGQLSYCLVGLLIIIDLSIIAAMIFGLIPRSQYVGVLQIIVASLTLLIAISLKRLLSG